MNQRIPNSARLIGNGLRTVLDDMSPFLLRLSYVPWTVPKVQYQTYWQVIFNFSLLFCYIRNVCTVYVLYVFNFCSSPSSPVNIRFLDRWNGSVFLSHWPAIYKTWTHIPVSFCIFVQANTYGYTISIIMLLHSLYSYICTLSNNKKRKNRNKCHIFPGMLTSWKQILFFKGQVCSRNGPKQIIVFGSITV
jgi:hypothetical protein